ncbi:MAG: asparagine synthase (glutamine-hydrolyzing), partial [Phycisphaerales bacterium]|nr:asparagine synthase (glutamine-hydrolyzing) [Phycisphaerales bacterium]
MSSRMCGLAGYLLLAGEARADTRAIHAMNRSMAHRGPDDEGIALIDPDRNHATHAHTDDTALGVAPPAADGVVLGHSIPHRVALAHRRFSIIAPGPGGHQPFWSPDGRACLTFNGEIYNHEALRRTLRERGVRFRTRCDTEVLLAAYRAWGMACFERLDGFFAIALYDRDARRLVLARDRMGQAPLYLARTTRGWFWASEIKGVRAGAGDAAFPVRAQAVADFVVAGHRDLADQTFFEGIETFPAAHAGWIDDDGALHTRRYWRLPRQRHVASDVDPDTAAADLRERLDEAVRTRLRADVPIAAELSGGMDSSSIVALARQHVPRLAAYTVSFPGTEADETRYAEAVVRHCGGIDHHLMTPPLDDFMQTCDRYVAHMDEPFHAPNLLTNQRAWSAMAAAGIRVSLNGGGGDEVLAGYGAHYLVPLLGQMLGRGDLEGFHRVCAGYCEKPAGIGSPAYTRRLLGALLHQACQAAPEGAAWWRRRRAARLGATLPLRGLPAPAIRPVSDVAGILRENATDWMMNYW